MAATLHRGDGHMAQKGRGIFMVYVDIDATHVQEFNEWYNKEHLPELLSVAGILSAARYEAVKGGPKYLACHERESVAVVQTQAFTHRPRTQQAMTHAPGFCRGVRTGESLSPGCALHQKDTVPGGERTVRQSARRPSGLI